MHFLALKTLWNCVSGVLEEECVFLYDGGSGCFEPVGVSFVYGASGRLCQGLAVPAHVLYGMPSAARGFTPSSDVLSRVQSCCSWISAGAPDQPSAAETPPEPQDRGPLGHTEGQIRQIYQLHSPGGPFKQLLSRSSQTGGKNTTCAFVALERE